MSSAESRTPPEPDRTPLPSEVVKARAEAPDFADVMGRARARALNQPYDPALHHPDAPRNRDRFALRPEVEAKLDAILERFRGKRRHLTVVDRPDLERSGFR